MKSDRPYDIVIYGATGYTGRLVAEYLAHHYQGKGPKWAPKWAMAGRSLAKLEEVRDLIGAPADTPLIEANSDDPASMAALAEGARVILTTVGPYQLYGEPLVKACVAAGTDYADLCGEPGWMREMIDRYDAAAKASGARIALGTTGTSAENPWAGSAGRLASVASATRAACSGDIGPPRAVARKRPMVPR